MTSQKYIFACDHRGTELCDDLFSHALSKGLICKMIGFEENTTLDYIDITKQFIGEIDDSNTLGVLICGNGQGFAIAANRACHIRAAVCHTAEDAISVRSKINANVLCLGSELSSLKQAITCFDAFITTPFDDQYEKRVSKLQAHVTPHTYNGINMIVRAIILHEDHILLTTPTKSNRDFATDLYFLPGGHVDHKESAVSALKRELWEEMNLEAKILDFSGALECCWDRKGHPYHELNLVYTVNIPNLTLDNPPRALDAVHTFVWVPISDIASYKMLPEKIIPLIQEAVANGGAHASFFSQIHP